MSYNSKSTVDMCKSAKLGLIINLLWFGIVVFCFLFSPWLVIARSTLKISHLSERIYMRLENEVHSLKNSWWFGYAVCTPSFLYFFKIMIVYDAYHVEDFCKWLSAWLRLANETFGKITVCSDLKTETIVLGVRHSKEVSWIIRRSWYQIRK